MVSILFLVVALFLLYAIIPSIAARWFGFGVFRKSRTRHEVAFTFDDGPDPIYTPQLLDLLKTYKIKAAFFVVGSKAERFPELILRMHQEGHLIGIHNYVHRSNWFLTPWTIRRHLDRSASFIENITGVRPVYYRPPWGLTNLFDFLLRQTFLIVLWSVMVGDWRSKGGSEAIKTRLLQKIQPGAVIVLHDSGETFGANRDAPLHTIQALDQVFPALLAKGYTCVRIDEMIPFQKPAIERKLSRKKRLLIYLWMQWEKAFHAVFHVRTIDRNNPFLNIRVCTYRGKTIQLTNGESIQKGDYVVELHFNNELLMQMATQARSSIHLAVQMIRATEQLLPQILEFIVHHPYRDKIKGLYGITMIYRGSRQLGFTVADLPKGLFSSCSKLYLRFLLYAVHPQGLQRLQTKTNLLIPKIIAISTNELMKRYPIDIQPKHSSQEMVFSSEHIFEGK
ncbi:polysaccharide deacetylase family protein [Fodinisporobacter ferrooxydans]|uniref:Polysaccharide deacetylase family protein n=1 Tax=Fodinisporobacter ferrooxydans TaxID=2901836 RepID=A0ABY4CKN6_9BACL|nr:polysaccharide deacetylase family protein [Alicyclobacillaceae bacterium MYW30-H2]